MLLAGEVPTTTKQFQNYVIRVTRTDWKTGELLNAKGFRLSKPFRPRLTEVQTSLSPIDIQGAANGSEGTLAD
jgi:hypothetical protein